MSKIFVYCAICDIVDRVATHGKYKCQKCGNEMQVKEVKEGKSFKFELKAKNG